MNRESDTHDLLEVLAEERVVDLNDVRGGSDFGHGRRIGCGGRGRIQGSWSSLALEQGAEKGADAEGGGCEEGSQDAEELGAEGLECCTNEQH